MQRSHFVQPSGGGGRGSLAPPSPRSPSFPFPDDSLRQRRSSSPFVGASSQPIRLPRSSLAPRALALYLVLFLSLLFLTFLTRSSAPISTLTETTNSLVSALTPSGSAPYCTAHQLLLSGGQWSPRSPSPRSVQDVKAIYGYQPYKALTTADGIINTYETRKDGLYCAAKSEEGKVSHDPTSKMRQDEEARLIRVAGWEWESEAVTRGDCQMKRWDWREVVKRLVMSRAGIIFLGDSLTAQQYDSLALLLGNQGPIIERIHSSPLSTLSSPPVTTPGRRLDVPRALFLSPTHPLTSSILDEIPLPREALLRRLQHPIARTVRTDFLITEGEVLEMGLKKHGMSKVRGTDWVRELEGIAEGKNEEGELMGVEEDEDVRWKRSLVVTSVGNWWERWVERSPSVTESLTLYRQAVHLAISHIVDLTAAPYDFTFFFRTVNRGHSHCENFEEPIVKHDTRAMDQDQYSWYLKAPMSDIWRAGLAPHLRLPNSNAPPPIPPEHIHLLDIVEQAYQRPDAHRFPPEDCLHWCLPSVLDDWNWTWWHLLSAGEEVAADGVEK